MKMDMQVIYIIYIIFIPSARIYYYNLNTIYYTQLINIISGFEVLIAVVMSITIF
jgi:hypothetical protein